MDVTIREESEDDVGAIAEVVAAAFGSQAEADLVERIRASPEYRPRLALVAEADGEIVGHVMISAALLRTATGDQPIVMLSPLAVAPTYQRRGVGAALVAEVCARAAAAGEPFVVLEGSPEYYSRLGFVSAATHGVSLPLPDWAPPEAAQLRCLGANVVTVPPGEVVYPASFDALH